MTESGLWGHVSALYDPLGIAAPASLHCKLLQREIIPQKDQDPHGLNATGWQDPIPPLFQPQWKMIIKINQEAQNIRLPNVTTPRAMVRHLSSNYLPSPLHRRSLCASLSTSEQSYLMVLSTSPLSQENPNCSKKTIESRDYYQFPDQNSTPPNNSPNLSTKFPKNLTYQTYCSQGTSRTVKMS